MHHPAQIAGGCHANVQAEACPFHEHTQQSLALRMKEVFQQKIIDAQEVMVATVHEDGVRVRQLEKDLSAVKAIAKA